MYNTRAHEKAESAASRVRMDPFEMIDKDSNSRNENDTTPRPRNRARGSGKTFGFGKKKGFEDLGHSTDEDDDEMLLGRRHNEEDYNSSDIEDENQDGDGDLFKPLLNSMTIDFKTFWSQFKSIGPKLVPFFKTLGIYFVMFIPVDRPSTIAMFIKCLPIASLALFVLLHGISLKEEHEYARRILAGLIMSCLGDALLIWPSYFVEGMIAFSAAQVLYILAFGFHPENWTLGVVLFGFTSIGLGVLVPGLMTAQPALMIGVPIYVVLLTTMVWRAMARVQFFDDLWSWTKLCSCFGGLCFAVSDSVLGLNKFYVEIPGSQAIIMGSYYLGQLGIALSVVNSEKKEGPNPDYVDDNEDSEYNRRNKVTWMEILEHTAPRTKTLEISEEDQREAELLYY